jgi:hypothetical protein
MAEKEQGFSRELLEPYVKILAKQFVQRDDMYPKQLATGQYVTVHELLHEGLLYDHLRGDITLGTYLLDPKSRGRFLVIDADDGPDLRRLQALSKALAEMGSASYLEGSRRGGHLWLFLDKPIHGTEIRTFGHGLLAYFGIRGIELFPKQDRLRSGPGSLVRMPFGVHRKSGRRYSFHSADGQPIAPTLREQIEHMRALQTVSRNVYERFLEYGTKETAKSASRAVRAPQSFDVDATEQTRPVSERLKSAMPVRQFILQYVELSKQGKGLCPLHDDHVESFSVNDVGNYWQCFACQKGGSIIDFWMYWQKCDFKTAVRELAEEFL